MIIVRYIIAGGTAAAVNLLALYFFTEYVGFHYLASAAIAFVIALIVSFTLQKFWTFQDNLTLDIHKQASVYAAVSIANFFLNLILMYFFVEKLHIWYLLAQVIINGGIAFSSFLIYRHFIFAKKISLQI
jgi:putative flippase GtrA